MKLKHGDRAPEFILSDQNGKKHKLSDFKGQWVLIYFYPRDNTPGCTKEACAFRDSFKEYEKSKIKVIGISTDSVEGHEKFAKKYQLPFTLLADEDKKVVEQYDVWGMKKFMGKEHMGTIRMSFLVDPKGNIAKIYEKVKPTDHAKEVLKDLRDIGA
ncbi:MAG: thioredoxin-dependent thiol peroxidase [Candidatus Kuenenia sp.]|nr:thioredoxin-dependent thiol peroxidase [Candidatus Kuenenia hertensis]